MNETYDYIKIKSLIINQKKRVEDASDISMHINFYDIFVHIFLALAIVSSLIAVLVIYIDNEQRIGTIISIVVSNLIWIRYYFIQKKQNLCFKKSKRINQRAKRRLNELQERFNETGFHVSLQDFQTTSDELMSFFDKSPNNKKAFNQILYAYLRMNDIVLDELPFRTKLIKSGWIKGELAPKLCVE